MVCENWQRPARRMPREIDEDVDLITADDLSRLLRRKVREIAVVFDGCLYLFRIDILRILRDTR